MEINLLFEDSDIIVCEKPAGVPSQSDKTADFDMVNRLKNYVYEKAGMKEQPYIGIVHRLDRPVGGIMVFAKTPMAAKQLSEQIRLKEVRKYYRAVITEDLTKELGNDKRLLTDYLVKDGRTNLTKITIQKDKNAKKAQLYYQVLQVKEALSLVDIELLTGRHHQIRVQMAEHVGGLFGDTKYNQKMQGEKGWKNIALFAYKLEFKHPKTKQTLCFTLEPQGDIWEFETEKACKERK